MILWLIQLYFDLTQVYRRKERVQGRRIDLENRPLTKYFMNMHFDKKNNVHRKIFHFKNWFMIMWCISLFITQVKVMMMTTNVVNVYNENPILDGSKLIHLNLIYSWLLRSNICTEISFLRKPFYGISMRSPILLNKIQFSIVRYANIWINKTPLLYFL